MKPVQYRGYIYWLLMILGAFFGNIIDGAHSDLFFPILIIIAFAIFGDLISQIIIWSKLQSASNLSTIKHYRVFSLLFSIIWVSLLCLPTFIDCMFNVCEIYAIPIIEILLLVLLYVNKFKWITYQIKNWTVGHNTEG